MKRRASRAVLNCDMKILPWGPFYLCWFETFIQFLLNTLDRIQNLPYQENSIKLGWPWWRVRERQSGEPVCCVVHNIVVWKYYYGWKQTLIPRKTWSRKLNELLWSLESGPIKSLVSRELARSVPDCGEDVRLLSQKSFCDVSRLVFLRHRLFRFVVISSPANHTWTLPSFSLFVVELGNMAELQDWWNGLPPVTKAVVFLISLFWCTGAIWGLDDRYFGWKFWCCASTIVVIPSSFDISRFWSKFLSRVFSWCLLDLAFGNNFLFPWTAWYWVFDDNE